MQSYEYLLSNIDNIKGIGKKTAILFKKRNINSIFDLIYNLPRDFIDRTDLRKINQLQIGKIHTVTVDVIKYNLDDILDINK